VPLLVVALPAALGLGSSKLIQPGRSSHEDVGGRVQTGRIRHLLPINAAPEPRPGKTSYPFNHGPGNRKSGTEVAQGRFFGQKPDRFSAFKKWRKPLILLSEAKVVAGARIELATQGFSVLRLTVSNFSNKFAFVQSQLGFDAVMSG
jgi:hypothetical protein